MSISSTAPAARMAGNLATAASSAANWIFNTSKVIGSGVAAGAVKIAQFATSAFQVIGNGIINGIQMTGNGIASASKVAASGISAGASKIAGWSVRAFHVARDASIATYGYTKEGAATGFSAMCGLVNAHPNAAFFTFGALTATAVGALVYAYNNRDVQQA